MRGAARETSRTILEHMRRRLAAISRELGAGGDDDERMWWASVDLAELGSDVDVLLDREKFPNP